MLLPSAFDIETFTYPGNYHSFFLGGVLIVPRFSVVYLGTGHEDNSLSNDYFLRSVLNVYKKNRCAALHQLKKQGSERTVQIGMIPINQNDIRERNYQISLTYRIYSIAETVLFGIFGNSRLVTT
jgi:hypothetical protein